MICSKCSKDQDDDKFSFKYKSLNIRKKNCKECDSKYRKKYYNENNDSAKKYAYTSNQKIKIRNQQFLWDFLLKNPCIDCGESDPIVLEFDHQSNKKIIISKMINNGYSIENIVKEINKCVVRCANCHRRKTAKDFNWYKNIKRD